MPRKACRVYPISSSLSTKRPGRTRPQQRSPQLCWRSRKVHRARRFEWPSIQTRPKSVMGLICGCSRAAILMAGLPQSTDKLSELHDEIELQLIAAERQQINNRKQSEKVKDEAGRGIDGKLGFHEATPRNQRAEK